MKSLIKKWFEDKSEAWIFVCISFTGCLGSLFTYGLLNRYPYNFGKNLIGVFIAPILSIAYLTYFGSKHQYNPKLLIKALLMYLLQILPFIPLFFQIFHPTHKDDFSRYYFYAENMYNNKTLWGGDKLFFKEAGYHFVTQPGYRYFVYLELVLFRDLYRIVSFINIVFYIVSVFYLQRLVQKAIAKKKFQSLIHCLIFLFTPYAIKNLLMGLPEWLTAIILIAATYLYVVAKRPLLASFVLGLVPFFRQNLLIAVLILFFYILLQERQRLKMLLLFLVPLFLPIYHNLYYAKQWKFFVDIFELPFLTYKGTSGDWGINFRLIINNLVHYLGIEIEGGTINVMFIGALFLPFASLTYLLFIIDLRGLKCKTLYLLTTCSAIIPILLLGFGYPPRFEFINTIVMLITYFILVKHGRLKKQSVLLSSPQQ